jgi:DNA-directed RNA polymerase subunit beta'
VKFGDISEGVTMQERVDEVTGLAYKVIIESRDPDLRPRISIKGHHRRFAEGCGAL